MNEQQRVQAEASAIRVAERIKARLLTVADDELQAMATRPEFARFALLEGSRAYLATILRHVLAEAADQERALPICAASVGTLDAIVTPTRRLH